MTFHFKHENFKHKILPASSAFFFFFSSYTTADYIMLILTGRDYLPSFKFRDVYQDEYTTKKITSSKQLHHSYSKITNT